jgi:glyoxylase-like metal-dependent hydrolase (beta-lactamase superfamily II)
MPFPQTTIEQWKEFPGLLNDKDEQMSRYGTVAIRSGGKLIIVDTGMQTAPGGQLLNDMKAKGVGHEDVDIVYLTHLHPDHVGWNLSSGKPTFPKARYIAPRRDFEYWTQPEVLEKAAHVQNQVMPLTELKLLDLVDDGYKITDELTSVPTPGHTPGHTSVMISSQGERAFVLGDVAHTPAQAHYTDWNPIFDILQDVSRKTRNDVMNMLEKDGILVSAGHFPDPGFGHFMRVEGRRWWKGL